MQKDKMTILGVMSGTSLDGLDLALCEFESTAHNHTYTIVKAQTIDYSPGWKDKLQNIKKASAEDYFKLHASYGEYMGREISQFLSRGNFKADAIASHGHTIFHQPKFGFTTQIGCGATIAAITNITTVCDFRSLDVALGGQGAPLVPIGDKLLFGKYQACLNIGGIANISFDKNEQRVAYDICEANMLLNYLAEKAGKAYDKGGDMARAGHLQVQLMNELNSLAYYSKKGAKSIGREWFEEFVIKLIEKDPMPLNDLLATATEHVAQLIAGDLDLYAIKTVLVTGGGAFNTFLIERIRAKTNCEIVIPDPGTVNFKEALIFAFLGYLRLNQKTNTLSSVTGATKDSIGGAVYLAR